MLARAVAGFAGKPDPDDVRLLQAVLERPGQLRRHRLEHDLELDLRDQLALQQERREVRARLRMNVASSTRSSMVVRSMLPSMYRGAGPTRCATMPRGR